MLISELISSYQTDRDSPFKKKRFHTRRYYLTLCKRLGVDFGSWELERIKARDLLHWNEQIIESGHTPMAHALVGMMRTLVNFGATILEDPQCERLSSMLHKMRFQTSKPRTERLTAEQAILIRNQARAMGRPSIALAEAIQFEGMLRQKDVIGEWVPETEPGDSDTFSVDKKHRRMKWLRGIRWERIDEDFRLIHITSKRQKEITIDLKLAPMVIEELTFAMGQNALGGLQRSKFPTSGPVIFCEATEVPWIANEFRRWWRKAANACGIPKNVRNMDSRAGAISEATDAGAELEHVRHAATHSDIAMTTRYSRGAEDKIANVQRLRVEHRSKSSAV